MGNNSQWGNKINETNYLYKQKKKKKNQNLGIDKKYTRSVGKTVLNPTEGHKKIVKQEDMNVWLK